MSLGVWGLYIVYIYSLGSEELGDRRVPPVPSCIVKVDVEVDDGDAGIGRLHERRRRRARHSSRLVAGRPAVARKGVVRRVREAPITDLEHDDGRATRRAGERRRDGRSVLR